VTFQDLVATLNGAIGRYISMTTLHVNLTRLIMEDASVLTDEEIDEVKSAVIEHFNKLPRLTESVIITARNVTGWGDSGFYIS
jgi:hypothetical protein